MNQKTGDDYLVMAAKALGYPDFDAIKTPGDLDRAARIAHALVHEYGTGYREGWQDALQSLEKATEQAIDRVLERAAKT